MTFGHFGSESLESDLDEHEDHLSFNASRGSRMFFGSPFRYEEGSTALVSPFKPSSPETLSARPSSPAASKKTTLIVPPTFSATFADFSPQADNSRSLRRRSVRQSVTPIEDDSLRFDENDSFENFMMPQSIPDGPQRGMIPPTLPPAALLPPPTCAIDPSTPRILSTVSSPTAAFFSPLRPDRALPDFQTQLLATCDLCGKHFIDSMHADAHATYCQARPDFGNRGSVDSPNYGSIHVESPKGLFLAGLGEGDDDLIEDQGFQVFSVFLERSQNPETFSRVPDYDHGAVRDEFPSLNAQLLCEGDPSQFGLAERFSHEEVPSAHDQPENHHEQQLRFDNQESIFFQAFAEVCESERKSQQQLCNTGFDVVPKAAAVLHPFPCDFCPARFPTEAGLKSHCKGCSVYMTTPRSERKPAPRKIPDQFFCEDCGRKFHSKQALGSHGMGCKTICRKIMRTPTKVKVPVAPRTRSKSPRTFRELHSSADFRHPADWRTGCGKMGTPEDILVNPLVVQEKYGIIGEVSNFQVDRSPSNPPITLPDTFKTVASSAVRHDSILNILEDHEDAESVRCASVNWEESRIEKECVYADQFYPSYSEITTNSTPSPAASGQSIHRIYDPNRYASNAPTVSTLSSSCSSGIAEKSLDSHSYAKLEGQLSDYRERLADTKKFVAGIGGALGL